ncbi:MAG: TerB family tellurite resistance protein [Gammaproteobacteria bacterium]|jgi:uncharacterized tellurite resistance protein B-like protein
MLDAIQTFLRGFSLSRTGDEPDGEHSLRLAVALLLLDVARADMEVSAEERQVARQLLERFFPVSPDQAQALVDAAQREAEHATSLYPFTSLINRECDMEERVRIVGMLWKVSCADGKIDAHEEHLVRKVADLLYVPHARFIQAKLVQTAE